MPTFQITLRDRQGLETIDAWFTPSFTPAQVRKKVAELFHSFTVVSVVERKKGDERD